MDDLKEREQKHLDEIDEMISEFALLSAGEVLPGRAKPPELAPEPAEVLEEPEIEEAPAADVPPAPDSGGAPAGEETALPEERPASGGRIEHAPPKEAE